MIWLLIIAISTLPIAYGIRLFQVSKFIKNVADKGYKFNPDRAVKENGVVISDDYASFDSTSHFLIPFYNIFAELINKKTYDNNKDKLFNQLIFKRYIIEMNEEEKEKYFKRPNALNAYLMQEKYEKDYLLSNKISLNDGMNSEIYYNTAKFPEIKITKTTGIASNLTEEEQLNYIYDDLSEHLYETSNKEEIDKVTSKEEYLKAARERIIEYRNEMNKNTGRKLSKRKNNSFK